MNVVFAVLSGISTFLVMSIILLWFSYMKKVPIFRKFDTDNDGIIYPSLSVIIPACNEAESIEQTVRQLITKDYPNLELVVVNDRSTDNTGMILGKLKTQYPQLKVITVNDLPPNWLGKNHAAYLGAQSATGEWLLFTDADVMFSCGSLKTTIKYCLQNSLDHLTIIPDWFYGGVFYRAYLVCPLFWNSMSVVSGKKMGIGAFNLLKKSVYQKIGGYEAIPMQVVDDLSLGGLVVDNGFKQGFGISGKGFITIRWYKNLFSLLKGVEKNSFAICEYNIVATLRSCLSLLLVGGYPFIGIFLGPIWARVLCGVSVLSWFACYHRLAKHIPISRIFMLFHPISNVIMAGAMLNSMIKTTIRGGVEWRGSFYPIEELKRVG